MVEMRYEVDVDEIERGIMKPMRKKPGLGKDLRSDVRGFIEEMLKAWETFVTPNEQLQSGEGETKRNTEFRGMPLVFSMDNSGTMRVRARRVHIFPWWHSLHDESGAWATRLRAEKTVMSYREICCDNISEKLSLICEYNRWCDAHVQNSSRELSEGLKRRRAERKRQRDLVREGCYKVEEDILKKYIKGRYFNDRTMILSAHQDFCIFASVYAEKSEYGMYNWFAKDFCMLHSVSGRERILRVRAVEKHQIKKPLTPAMMRDTLELFMRAEDVSSEDKAVIKALITFNGL
jgi:hypothetical protein